MGLGVPPSPSPRFRATADQTSFAGLVWSSKGRISRPERALTGMDASIPWQRLIRAALSEGRPRTSPDISLSRASEELSFRGKRGICSGRCQPGRTADPSQARDDRIHQHRCNRKPGLARNTTRAPAAVALANLYLVRASAPFGGVGSPGAPDRRSREQDVAVNRPMRPIFGFTDGFDRVDRVHSTAHPELPTSTGARGPYDRRPTSEEHICGSGSDLSHWSQWSLRPLF
jgi:hypothetical protein